MMSQKNNGMSFLSYTKKALNIALHPGSISESYNIGDAIAFYYKAAVIPAIISAVIGFLLFFAFGSLALSLFTGLSSLASSLFAAGSIIFGLIGAALGLAYVLLLIPISIIIDGAIYQLFAKILFKIWNKDISKTITALTYASFPAMLFVWALFIPVVGIVIDIIIAIWSFIVLIISLARQQGISGWRAFGGIFVSGIILAVIIIVIELAVLVPLLSIAHPSASTSYLSASCVPASSFICLKPSYSNGVLKAEIGQSTGADMFNAQLFFVSAGENFSASDPSYYIGGLSSESLVNASIPGISEINGSVQGNLTLEYYNSVSQKTPYIKNIAIFFSSS